MEPDREETVANDKKSAADDRRRIIAESKQREQGYRERALKLFPWICSHCGRDFTLKKLHELTVHHKDSDHHNNPPDGSNWELLCGYCHDNLHARDLDAEHYAEEQPGGDRAQKPSMTHNPFAGLAGLIDDKKR